jgi:hypothetical protein
MESELELKPHSVDVRTQRDSDLSNRLAKAFAGQSVSSVATRSGYHPESVRRYFQGVGRIPADFVGQIVGEFDLSAHYLLKGVLNVPDESELRLVTTDRLINELGRRIRMIENSAVGSVLVHDSRYRTCE